jgi:AcrR family transcriptional regulator
VVRRPAPGARERKKEEIRRRLIDAAAEVFAERGLSAASLDEIADVAGLTKGAVYSQFDSKFGLAIEVLERCINKAVSIFSEVDPSLPIQEQFLLGAKLFAKEVDDFRPWFRLEMECQAQAHLYPEIFVKIQERHMNQLEALTAALDAHFAEFGLTDIPVVKMANSLMVVSYGVSFARFRDPDSMPVALIARILASVQLPYLSTVMSVDDIPA